jgi:hypothetical protein
MRDIDPLTRALRGLTVHDVNPHRSRAILADARGAMVQRAERGPSWLDAIWTRFMAPTLVTATVASYLVWALTAAGALYR